MMLMGIILLGSCNGCQQPKEAPGEKGQVFNSSDYDGVITEFTAGTDHIVAMHRQAMFDLCGGKKYEWRNLQIKFNDVISTENVDDLKIVDVTSVFYYWDNGPWVQYITSNVQKGMLIPAKIPDVWIEDGDMSEAVIKLSAEDAMNRLKEWNGTVPTSRSMVLRLPIGPRRCNAQWVIGNIGMVIFIDAVTGEITDWCPAFPNPNANGPLGEWP